MQRYLLTADDNFQIEDNYDVIILGTGIAGLFAALNIDDQYRVLILTKTNVKTNNSSLAQGGVATAIDVKIHFQDTLRAGGYYNNRQAVEALSNESESVINKLIAFGVAFDSDNEGNVLYTQEGGHSQKNILHVKDQTGKSIIDALTEYVIKKKNVEIHENEFAIDILTMEGAAKGVIAFNKNQEKLIYLGKAVVVATGGVGQVYSNTTNESIATGDGIAMAHRAGAKLRDMEFVQFHPTALFQEKHMQRFLISEAVRGEGAILRNNIGEAFMEKYHEKKELAPRDIVARAIFKEMEKTDHFCVYLDITHREPSYIKERFPMIYRRCLDFGYDITKELIPVAPVEHYFMGGIETDLEGKTNIYSLYACGECACTGVHGANRLASNSLLEALVFSDRVTKVINSSIYKINQLTRDELMKISICSTFNPNNLVLNREKGHKEVDLNELQLQLKETMNKYVSIIRTRQGLKEAYQIIDRINYGLKEYRQRSIQYFELINMITVARKIVEAAYIRTESLGAHYLIDDIDIKENLIC